ncbi:TPA: type II toxin-antitoxin system RelE/ParE family toxin [Klebsiella oxytoca]|uniref:type II toxin-antitoxin system RelE/ParE family toxin n=1 Tax=Klebsiella oxytoca TaxID=571 RepID=UPI0021AE3770|nr:type II toxin-antitoxin system RelE/ParE family toxin [Klebsiella oxytoca]
MKEIELTPEAEEVLESIWDYSFRLFGVVQADAYISRVAAAFYVLAMHYIGTHCADAGRKYHFGADGTHLTLLTDNVHVTTESIVALVGE